MKVYELKIIEEENDHERNQHGILFSGLKLALDYATQYIEDLKVILELRNKDMENELTEQEQKLNEQLLEKYSWVVDVEDILISEIELDTTNGRILYNWDRWMERENGDLTIESFLKRKPYLVYKEGE